MKLKMPKFYIKKTKKQQREAMIMEEYEKGRILQVDGKTDNKKYLEERQ